MDLHYRARRIPLALVGMVEALSHRNGSGGALRGASTSRRAAPWCSPLRSATKRAAFRSRSTACSSTRAELRTQLAKKGYTFSRSAATPRCSLRAYQHWDKEVVKHLRGGFAFALWDARKERLMLARDRFGEKPLYLARSRRHALLRLRDQGAGARAGREGRGRRRTRSAITSRSATCAARARWSRRAQARAGHLRAVAVRQPARDALLDSARRAAGDRARAAPTRWRASSSSSTRR